MRKIILATMALALSVASALAAASHNDSAVLSSDPTFQNRVREALAAACITVANEAISASTLSLHKKRADLCVLILNAPDSYKILFAFSVATDASVLADATANGTVALTSGNVATQEALVTDAHIDAAIGNQANAYLVLP